MCAVRGAAHGMSRSPCNGSACTQASRKHPPGALIRYRRQQAHQRPIILQACCERGRRYGFSVPRPFLSLTLSLANYLVRMCLLFVGSNPSTARCICCWILRCSGCFCPDAPHCASSRRAYGRGACRCRAVWNCEEENRCSAMSTRTSS